MSNKYAYFRSNIVVWRPFCYSEGRSKGWQYICFSELKNTSLYAYVPDPIEETITLRLTI